MVNRPDKTPATEGEREAAEMRSVDTPTTDDPAVAAAPEAAPAAQPVAGEGAEVEAGADAPKPESSRDRVARRFAERRQAELEGNPFPTLLDEPPAADAPSAPAAAAPPTPPVPGAAAPATDDPILKLKIDGRELELPQSEVIRIAQTNAAIEARGRALAEINLELSRKREELANASRTAPAADTTGARPRSATPPTPPAPRETTNLDEAQLRDIAERITGGTLEEQTAALRELAQSITPPAPEPVDVDGRINAAFAAREAETEVNGMVQEFVAEYPDIGKDPDLRDIAYKRVVGEMLSDLEAAGVQPADMAKLRSVHPVYVANAHRAFREAVNPDGRRSYPNVRHYQAVLKSAGDAVMAKFGRTADPAPQPAAQPQPQPQRPANGLAARTDLKRGLTPTPRTTQIRAEPPAATPAGGNPSAKAAVSKIAALRSRGRGALVQ